MADTKLENRGFSLPSERLQENHNEKFTDKQCRPLIKERRSFFMNLQPISGLCPTLLRF
jgi:hypothetical protein